MSIVAGVLVALVAALHLWFLVLEMLLWQKPIGMRTFGLTPERAELTAALAANQGLYNGFLVAGLVVGMVATQPSAFQAVMLATVTPPVGMKSKLPFLAGRSALEIACRAGGPPAAMAGKNLRR